MSLKFFLTGFTVVRSNLSDSDISKCRDEIQNEFKNVSIQKELLASQIFKNDNINRYLISDKLLKIARNIVGPKLAIYPNVTVRKNLYTGWHVDKVYLTGPPSFLSIPTKFVQCAMYFQANDKVNGGGLDVKLFSHFIHSNYKSRYVNFLFGALERFLPSKTVYCAPGDIIVFHRMLNHQGSQRVKNDSSNSKLGLFWTLSQDSDMLISKHLKYFYDELNNSKTPVNDIRAKFSNAILSKRFQDVLEIDKEKVSPNFLENLSFNNIKAVYFNDYKNTIH